MRRRSFKTPTSMLRRLPFRPGTTLGARRRRRTLGRFIIFSVFMVGGLSAFIWLSYRPQFEITRVTVSGTNAVTMGEIESLTRHYLTTAVWGVLPASNTFLFPSRGLTSALLKKFKTLSAISADRAGLTTLAIRVKERLPEFLWCREDAAVGPETCYDMDGGGFIFASAPTIQNPAHLKFYGFFDAGSDPLGAVYLGPERFQEVSDFLAALRGIDFLPTALKRSAEGEYRVSLKRGTDLLLDERGDLSRALSNLSSLLDDVELAALFARDPLPFEYIDLRLPNKVFYRRR